MMNIRLKTLVGFLCAFACVFVSCSKDKEGVNGEKDKEVIESSEAKILSFSLPTKGVTGTIFEEQLAINIDRKHFVSPDIKDLDLSGLTPKIEVSAGATISPDPNIPQNFNNKVEYTVTAKDGTKRIYKVDELAGINDFKISKGINIASWISTPKYTGAARTSFFTEADVKLLSELGFDHIRLLIDEVELWDATGKKIRPYAFDLLHNAIAWCKKYNMRVIVDLHITRNHRFTLSENTLFTDPNEPAKFVKLWQDLSDELKGYPNSLVAYELLNEPVSLSGAANWNRVSALAINAIRERELNRTIVVGVCTVNGGVKYKELELPSKHRILSTFHYYGPFLLTYFGFESTTNKRTDIAISYPGSPLVAEEDIDKLPTKWQATGRATYDKPDMARRMKDGFDMAKRLDVPVFVGEFGTANLTPEPSRANWYKDVVAISKDNNAAYTSFDYKGAGYSVVNEDRTLRYPEIINIITGK